MHGRTLGSPVRVRLHRTLGRPVAVDDRRLGSAVAVHDWRLGRAVSVHDGRLGRSVAVSGGLARRRAVRVDLRAFQRQVVGRRNADAAVVTVAVAVAVSVAVSAAVSLLGDVALQGELIVGPVKVHSLLRDRLIAAFSVRNADALDDCGPVIFGCGGFVCAAHLKNRE